MIALTLIAAAERAGLSVTPVGDRLRITGPKTAAPIARQILAHKAEVFDALAPFHAWWLIGNRPFHTDCTRCEAHRP